MTATYPSAPSPTSAPTYIDRQVERANRNLLLINGGILAVMVFFILLMVLAALTLRQSRTNLQNQSRMQMPYNPMMPSAPVDMSHPLRLSAAEAADPARLAQLEGKAVTYTDKKAQDVGFPVFAGMSRVSQPNTLRFPPDYIVSRVNGQLFLILPSGPPTSGTFTGVIRPLWYADRDTVTTVLRSRNMQQELQPFVLDCLSAGGRNVARALPVEMHSTGKSAGFPWFIVIFALPVILCGWNVVKGLQRKKNPRSHPIYAALAAYGSPRDIARAIEAERQQGVQQIGVAEFTYSWLLIPSLFSLDVVPLDRIVWIFKMVQRVNFIPVYHGLRVLDRDGKGHPIRSNASQVERLLAYIVQVRPWVLAGYDRNILYRYTKDRAGLIAEVDARRQRYAPPPPQRPL